MNTSLDLSFDTSNLLESHQLNAEDFFPDDDFLSQSPSKPSCLARPSKMPSQDLDTSFIPDLRPLGLASTNELFQVTHHLRASSEEHHLHNDKIAKLLRQLSDENEEYEMDDKVRTRVFKGRFNGPRRPDNLDTLDMHLDSYLHGNTAISRSPSKQAKDVPNENKENIRPMIEPSKRKLSDSNDRRAPLKKLKSHENMPTLRRPKMMPSPVKPGVSFNLFTSPKRVCAPKDTQTPGKPNLKHRQNLSIYLVDSLTGSVNDATQFGTELNSSNCEGFPLPDDINEIVQIPTNDAASPSAAQKMAIIKAVHGVRLPSYPEMKLRTGFYSKKEFENFKLHKRQREEALAASIRKVRWAEDLEW